MNYKAHIALVAGILVFIGAIALVGHFRKEAAIEKMNDPALKVDDTIYVNIDSATYGANCNGQDAASVYGNAPDASQLGPDGKYLVREGNATEAILRICKQQKKCVVSISESNLGFDPATGCKKSLDVGYRCFSFDTLRKVSAKGGSDLVIDCIPAASSY